MTRPLALAIAIGILWGLVSLVPTAREAPKQSTGTTPVAGDGLAASTLRPVAAVASASPTAPGKQQKAPSAILGTRAPSESLAAASPKPPQRTPGPVNTSKRVPATLSGALEVPATFAVVRNGLASWYDVRGLVALPDGPGWRFRVCGPGGCRVLVSTDTGPFVAGRVVDLDPHSFLRICGIPLSYGLCPVSIVILGHLP